MRLLIEFELVNGYPQQIFKLVKSFFFNVGKRFTSCKTLKKRSWACKMITNVLKPAVVFKLLCKCNLFS